jgi:glycosyltransferase involved in cell wall biosynthesis
MKLLIYSHSFAPSIGGVETSVFALAQGLSELRRGEQPQFAITIATQSLAHEFDDSFLRFAVIRRPTIGNLWRVIRHSDVIHIAGPALTPLLLGFLARKPIVVEHHGYQAICPNGILIHQPDGTICPGHFQARRYAECLRCQSTQLPVHRSVLSLLLTSLRFVLVRKAAKNLAITGHVRERHKLANTQIVYYGIEDPGTRVDSNFASSRKSICFAFVGRFVPEKGIPVLLQAARQLMAESALFKVVLIGDGPERAMLENIISRDQMQKHVRITGYLRGAELEQSLRDVDVVVMPSVWEETAGLAAIEQMMRGRLVIASDIGGLGEVVGDAGLRFAAGDSAALAVCMRRALQEPSLIERFGRSARLRALSFFTRKRMIEEHQSVYEHVVNATGG